MLNNTSIRSNLVLLILAVSIPLSTIVGYLIYTDMLQSVDQTNASLRAMATMTANSTNEKIRETRLILERLLARRPAGLPVRANNCDPLLKDLHAMMPGYTNIGYTDAKGQVICSALPMLSGRPLDVGRSQWFQDLKANKRFTVGPPFIGVISQKWVLVFTIPVLNEQKEMVGGINLSLDLQTYDPKIPTSLLPPNSHYGFFDTDGTLVWLNVDPDGVQRQRGKINVPENVSKFRDGEFESMGEDGIRRVYSVVSMPEVAWFAFVGVSVDAIYAPAKRKAVTATLLTLGAMALLVWLAFAIARRIALPILALESTVRSMQDGDPSAKAAITGPREVAAVAIKLNALAQARLRDEKELNLYQNHLKDLVTERTEALSLAMGQAKAASVAKSHFLANMSHELRTPLNAILGFAKLLERDQSVKEQGRKMVQTINRSGQHLLALINDVLEISRIEANRVVIQNEPFNLPDMLSSVEEMMGARAQSKGLAFHVEHARELPAAVEGDAHHLKQVLINLLGNAVKYTEYGKVTLVVSKRGTDVRFDVMDTGPGISLEDQERIFEPFYQTADGVDKGEGTGLGLAISREYTRAMSGQLSVKSQPGQGSCFSLVVPLPAAEAVTQLPTMAIQIVGLAPESQEVRILVVDDQADNRELLQQLLHSVGIEAQSATNGQEALAVFKTWRPHFIWMDMRMPVMDGYEATRQIRQLTGGDKVRIVALTASAFVEDQEKIFQAGCDDVVSKPFEEKELFEVMGSLLGLRYRYAPPGPPTAKPADTKLDLRAIPETVRHSLSAAASALDLSQMRQIVAHIALSHPELAAALDAQVKAYQFDRIIALCKVSASI